MSMIDSGTNATVGCRVVWAVACNDAFCDAWQDAGDDADSGLGEPSELRIAENIARNVANRGYTAGAPCIDEYRLNYRTEYLEALGYEKDSRMADHDQCAWLEAVNAQSPDRDRSRKCPEWEADSDANFDACYALHCQAHGHGGGPRPTMRADRHNPGNDPDFTRRYVARYDERYPHWLAIWRERNAAKAAA